MIKINNKNYEFKFGFKAMLKFEESTGQSISSLSGEFKLANIVEMTHAGLVNNDLTRDDIIDAIDADLGLMQTLTEAFEKDMAAMNSIDEEAKK